MRFSMSGIKREPGVHQDTPESPCAGRSDTSRNPRRGQAAPTIISLDTYVNSPSRQARSNAPSVDTARPRVTARMAPSMAPADDDDDCVVLTQVRPRVKPEPDRRPQPAFMEHSVSSDSLLNRNFEKIANNLKALGETLGELQSLGIRQVADLPSLVLVGDQSSGKSTLMSGIAGISLPHRDGMCTRCPVHIRLSKSESWALKISLQQDYSYDGQMTQRLTKDKEFGPWTPQPRVIKDFWSCNNKSDERIRIAIRWAQIAILNHNTAHRFYIPQYSPSQEFDVDAEESKLREYENSAEAAFSPNTVALHISGPNIPDISFYDLPGLIKTPKHEEDTYLVKVVENLARKYISDKHAIILWALPMNADAENSSTLNIIRKEKAQDRTVGVMTKADLLSHRSFDQWIAMLEGRQHSVGHGFFITARQPILDFGQNIDLEKQNSYEESYFNRQNGQGADEATLWPLQFRDYAHRCGLSQLVVFLSNTLSTAFVKSLPGILATIDNRLSEVKRELLRLPGTPLNPYAELREALMLFMGEVKQKLQTGGEFDSAWGDLMNSFEDKILKLKPKYVVDMDCRAAPATPNSRADPLVIDDNTSDDTVAPPPSASSRRRNYQAFADGQSELATPKRPRHNAVEEEEMFVSPAPSRMPEPPKSKSLEEVRRRILGRTRQGVPDVTIPEVYEELSVEAISLWDSPLDGFVVAFIRLLHLELEGMLEQAFHKLRNKAAFREAKAHLTTFVNERKETLAQSLYELYTRETKRLYTRDKDTFNRHKADEASMILHVRHYNRWKAHLAAMNKEPRALKALKDMTSDDKREMAKEQAILGDDPYKQEIGVCAYVRGYYLTAARRFVDSVALAVVSESIPTTVSALTNPLTNYLDDKLGLLNGPGPSVERINELMGEEREVSVKRTKLQDEECKLTKAMESIANLESAGGNDEADGNDVASQTTNPATSFASRLDGSR